MLERGAEDGGCAALGMLHQQQWRYFDGGAERDGESIVVTYGGGQGGASVRVTFVCSEEAAQASPLHFAGKGAGLGYEM